MSNDELVLLVKDRMAVVFQGLTGQPLVGEEDWVDDRCISRYLRATRYNIDDCVARISKTLQWRRDYRPTEITADEVEPEAVTGKEFFSGYDKYGRPLLFLVPANENTKTYERQLRFVVFKLEKGVKLMPEGVEQFTIIIDYENMNMFNATPPSVSKKFLDILSNHYPERLGKAFMINPSWYLWVFFKLLGPFLDPATKEKIHFVRVSKQKENRQNGTEVEPGTGGWTNIFEFIDQDQLPDKYGGNHSFVYDHKTYWAFFSNLK